MKGRQPVTADDGARAVPAGGLRNPALGRLRASNRPALGPVREVLAALAPGRVLPFAPGNSRKRGPELSRGSKLGERRGGAPRGERAYRLSPLPRPQTRPWLEAPIGAPPPFVLWGGKWKWLSWTG